MDSTPTATCCTWPKIVRLSHFSPAQKKKACPQNDVVLGATTRQKKNAAASAAAFSPPRKHPNFLSLPNGCLAPGGFSSGRSTGFYRCTRPLARTLSLLPSPAREPAAACALKSFDSIVGFGRGTTYLHEFVILGFGSYFLMSGGLIIVYTFFNVCNYLFNCLESLYYNLDFLYSMIEVLYSKYIYIWII